MSQTERKYFDMEIEPILNTPQIRELQWRKLKQSLEYFYEKVPFDRKRMEKAGVKPEDIRSFDDFARRIPYAGQVEFRELIEEVGADMDRFFLDLFGKERYEDLYLLTTTSGTTGIPTPYPIFKKALDRQADIFARIGWRIGLRPGDRGRSRRRLVFRLIGLPRFRPHSRRVGGGRSRPAEILWRKVFNDTIAR